MWIVALCSKSKYSEKEPSKTQHSLEIQKWLQEVKTNYCSLWNKPGHISGEERWRRFPMKQGSSRMESISRRDVTVPRPGILQTQELNFANCSIASRGVEIGWRFPKWFSKGATAGRDEAGWVLVGFIPPFLKKAGRKEEAKHQREQKWSFSCSFCRESWILLHTGTLAEDAADSCVTFLEHKLSLPQERRQEVKINFKNLLL